MEVTETCVAFKGIDLDVVVSEPAKIAARLVHAHGAGAGIAHPTQRRLAESWAECGIASVRFNFPFMQRGKRRVDSKPVATAAILTLARWTAERCPGTPLYLSGHSFGARMASHAARDASDLPLCGLVLCGFPLHPVGRPATERAAHLADIRLPMLFLSGTRDALAEAGRLEAVVAGLATAELHWLDTADHGYRILKRSRQSPEDIFDEMARVSRAFIARTAPRKGL